MAAPAELLAEVLDDRGGGETFGVNGGLEKFRECRLDYAISFGRFMTDWKSRNTHLVSLVWDRRRGVRLHGMVTKRNVQILLAQQDSSLGFVQEVQHEDTSAVVKANASGRAVVKLF